MDSSVLPSVNIAQRLSSGDASLPSVPHPRRVFDLHSEDSINIRAGDRLGWADSFALGYALRTARHLHTLKLWRVGLPASGIVELARIVPATALRKLAIEDNELFLDCEKVLLPFLDAPESREEDVFVGKENSVEGKEVSEAKEIQPASSTGTSTHNSSEIPKSQDNINHSLLLTPEAIKSQPSPSSTLPLTMSQAWAYFASRASPLTHLSLRSNNLNSKDGAAIGLALAHNLKLVHLDLSGNPLKDEGVAGVCFGLGENTGALSHIGLSGVNCGPVGCAAVGRAICGAGWEGLSISEEDLRMRDELEKASSEFTVTHALACRDSGLLSQVECEGLGVVNAPPPPPATPAPTLDDTGKTGKAGKGGKGAHTTPVETSPLSPPPPPPPSPPSDMLKFRPPGQGAASLKSLDLSLNPDIGIEGVVSLVNRLAPPHVLERMYSEAAELAHADEAKREAEVEKLLQHSSPAVTDAQLESSSESVTPKNDLSTSETVEASLSTPISQPSFHSITHISLYRCTAGITSFTAVDPPFRTSPQDPPQLKPLLGGEEGVDINAFAQINTASPYNIEKTANIFSLRRAVEGCALLGVTLIV